jgi:hypothetical protein
LSTASMATSWRPPAVRHRVEDEVQVGVIGVAPDELLKIARDLLQALEPPQTRPESDEVRDLRFGNDSRRQRVFRDDNDKSGNDRPRWPPLPSRRKAADVVQPNRDVGHGDGGRRDGGPAPRRSAPERHRSGSSGLLRGLGPRFSRTSMLTRESGLDHARHRDDQVR